MPAWNQIRQEQGDRQNHRHSKGMAPPTHRRTQGITQQQNPRIGAETSTRGGEVWTRSQRVEANDQGRTKGRWQKASEGINAEIQSMAQRRLTNDPEGVREASRKAIDEKLRLEIRSRSRPWETRERELDWTTDQEGKWICQTTINAEDLTQAETSRSSSTPSASTHVPDEKALHRPSTGKAKDSKTTTRERCEESDLAP